MLLLARDTVLAEQVQHEPLHHNAGSDWPQEPVGDPGRPRLSYRPQADACTSLGSWNGDHQAASPEGLGAMDRESELDLRRSSFHRSQRQSVRGPDEDPIDMRQSHARQSISPNRALKSVMSKSTYGGELRNGSGPLAPASSRAPPACACAGAQQSMGRQSMANSTRKTSRRTSHGSNADGESFDACSEHKPQSLLAACLSAQQALVSSPSEPDMVRDWQPACGKPTGTAGRLREGPRRQCGARVATWSTG